MQSSESQNDDFSLNINPTPFGQKEFNFDEIEEEPIKEQEPLKRTDNNSSSYTERQSNINVGEEIFESYMNENNYEFQRFGFDEKNNNIKGFILMNPFLL